MTNLAKLKKLIPSDHGYADIELTELLADNGNDVYKTAAFVLRGLIAQIVSGSYSFSSGDVKIDKTKLVDNYQRLIAEYETKSIEVAQSPSSIDELWGTKIDRLSGLDRTDYAEADTEDVD